MLGIKLTRIRRLGSGLLVSVGLSLALVAAGSALPALNQEAAAANATGCSVHATSFAAETITDGGEGLRVGCAGDSGSYRSLASSDNDVVAALDFDASENPDRLQQSMQEQVADVHADQAKGNKLSQAFDLEAQKVHVGYYTPQPDNVTYDGTLQIVGNSVVIVVPAADIGTAGFWDGFWKKMAVGAFIFGAAVGITAACLGAFNVGAPLAAPVCGALAGGLSSGFGELLSAVLDHKKLDAEAWGGIVGAAVWGATQGAIAGAVVQIASKLTNNFLISTQSTLKRWGATFTNWEKPIAFVSGLLNPNTAQTIIETLQRLQRGVGVQTNGSVCEIYASGGTPCAAAYSMDRALYAGYDGPLYQVKRASDGTTRNIGLLATSGYVDASQQDSFCANTACTITEIYDQSPDGNNLTIGGPGGSTCSSAPGYSCSGQADHGADASRVPVTVGGSAKIEAYGLDITGGVGYADDATTGVAAGDQPEGTYMVASGTNVNGQCCMDFGNAETSRDDTGNGHMDAVRIGSGAGIPGTCWFTPCNGSGPWVGVDMENGTFLGANGSYPGNTAVPYDFVTAMAKNDGQSTYAIETGNAQSGGLTTQWSGALPDLGGYMPMQKEGGIVLGTGGDNSNAGIGTWFEGVMTAGYPSSAADAAVQANIAAASYAGNSAGPAGTSNSTTSAGTAGQAVLHDGYTSVYTVNAKTGDLDETYLPAICAPNCAPGQGWATADLSATAHTPPVLAGTQPVALHHDGYTSVYTVDASTGDLDETYLAALCAPSCAPGQGWATQDLSKHTGTPPTLATPSAVYHDGYVSVYTTDATSGHLQETYLPAICAPSCAPGQGWATQDLSLHPGTPRVMVLTAPVAVLHDGYVSVYTVDASDGHLDETFLATLCAPSCAPGQGWATQDLSATVGTPPTAVTPGADYHSGYTSVYTVDASTGHLDETYLAALCAPSCAPGQGWATQDLSQHPGTPRVRLGTSPVALFHGGVNSVYTVDASDGHLDETYLSALCAPNCTPGQGWATQDLSLHPGTPPTQQTPIALLHLDQSGGLNWVSVWTINSSNNHLDETYLPALCAPNCTPGQGWATQDLSANPGTPPAT